MPNAYCIRVQGHLDATWSDEFAGMQIVQRPEGITELHGTLADQAALHGVIQRIRDLGLVLLEVKWLGNESRSV
jgi:hypothetical protein